MSITFGGRRCLDPTAVADFCAREGLPAGWLRHAPNSYLNPLGGTPGTGAALLRRADLDALDLAAEHSLTFSLPRASNNLGEDFRVEHRGLHVVEASCVTPGRRGDPDAAHLLRLADVRGRLALVLAPSRPGPSATWEGVVRAVWDAPAAASGGALTLGPWPGLPLSPHGSPGIDADVYQWPVTDALDRLLGLVGCALRYDSLAGAFSIVALGADDPAREAAAAARSRLRFYDDYHSSPPIGWRPEKVAVAFRYSGSLGPCGLASRDGRRVHEVSDPGAGASDLAGVATGTRVLILDDAVAEGSPGEVPANDAALLARAQARAADWFRRNAGRGERSHAAYAAPLADAGLLPGPQVSATRWSDAGGGQVTEVFRPDGGGGSRPPPAWEGPGPAAPPGCVVWYSGYLHLLEPAVAEGDALSPRQLVGSLGPHPGGAHLHLSLGDGVGMLSGDPASNNFVGQTFEFASGFGLPRIGLRLPGLPGPGPQSLSPAALAAIRARLALPLDAGAGWAEALGSSMHSGLEYFAADLTLPPADDQAEAGLPAYNVAASADVSTVVWRVLPQSHGWAVILRHQFGPGCGAAPEPPGEGEPGLPPHDGVGDAVYVGGDHLSPTIVFSGPISWTFQQAAAFNVTEVFVFAGPGHVCFESAVGFEKSVSWGYAEHTFTSGEAADVGPFDAPVVLMDTNRDTDMVLGGVEPLNRCGGGQRLLLVNLSQTYNLILVHDSEAADLEHRFLLPGKDEDRAGLLYVPPNGAREVWYDPSEGVRRWHTGEPTGFTGRQTVVVSVDCVDDELVAVTRDLVIENGVIKRIIE